MFIWILTQCVISENCFPDRNNGCTANGKACIFPFRYKGCIFKGCTYFDTGYDEKSWCATQVNFENEVIIGQWEHCDDPQCKSENLLTFQFLGFQV